MGVACLIPAKMTSVRLPGKNLIDLCGKPLLYYSIRAAQLTNNIDEVYVSSEDNRVLNAATLFGATPILRPAELSMPHVPNIEVLRHFYDHLQQKPKEVILLQPTHPLRHPTDLEKAINLFINSAADCLLSVIEVNGLLNEIDNRTNQLKGKSKNKTLMSKMYKNTGSFYIFRPKKTFITETFFGKNIITYILKRPDLEVDIDTEYDLKLARCLLNTYKNEFHFFFEKS